MNYEGIVVLGAPRSGTTLVRRLLDAHPVIHCPPETNLLRACASFLHEEPMTGGVGIGVRSGLAFSGVPEDQIVGQLRELAFGTLRGLAAKAGKARWAEKTAFDSFHVEEIEALCAGHCRFICVFRHGLDVASSTRELTDKMGMYPGELHEYVRRYPWPLEAFAHAWADVSCQLHALVARQPDTALALRYEDLVREPAAQLERLCAFLEEPADIETILANVFRPGTPGLGDWKTYQTSAISDRSVGRWRSLGADAIGRLAPIVNPVLELTGYEPLGVPRRPTAEAARRALQLSLLAAAMRTPKEPGPQS